MAIELRQQLKLTQQLVMTPQLQMAIKLLQLSRLELMDTIRQELEENPALEEVQEEIRLEERTADGLDDDRMADKNDASPESLEVKIEEKIPEDIDWSSYIEEYNSPGRVSYEAEEKEAPRYEAFIAQKELLSGHLLWQFLMTSPSPEEEKIGSLIIGNLNRNGFLEVSVEELAEMGCVNTDRVQKVLTLLQGFDPIGVCARNLQESLLIQARHYGCDDPVVTEIINHHINHLENKNYKAIARALKVGIDHVIAAVNVIKGLEPRPGRQFSDDESHYITPDIYVYKVEDDFVIVLNDDGMPKLRVNHFYHHAMGRGGALSGSVREYMQEKMRSAAWLIKSIQQRQKTIYRVMESILKHQRAFFEKGIAHLRPMILKDVAEDIDMHESTISRVTTNKYVYTPQGIFELKYFFNSSINRVNGDAVASASVQDRIRQIIEGEDPRKPYSDEKISRILEASNIDIARRTVAKYREMMKILPSNKRKQF
ncbi:MULTISPECIES: RNA polymerase factor sigma-54 [Desulfococcus]|jgi:RNA polymerase sigma-54 factor|uniref:RNA polymerase, sigma 54 subunit, RpoN n=1 Tax=Desulfococcus multivorans DSM 2059 TaxID=1121405 RepID=S7TNV7_DESML|nr:RNA polymerase factor sigma-54 [Desulfococcus multivorans]AOY57807.1 RpoN: RNA polymerase sigma54 factor [Desulfococcus multivorans]AQV00192.1 RNA polymerase sigma-54 factor [Desulfococcus multivorans]EPR38892.1 RNA polymerase, sigma 54 subunit, RpoN [Desulfococcus multivorans DSM 2059]SJZ67892.1 RNA polymerase, sigma 54 subunit, RpoN/SigL [Desulfococcus multivorans DSM 2059]